MVVAASYQIFQKRRVPMKKVITTILLGGTGSAIPL
jgi:hypothetical protein